MLNIYTKMKNPGYLYPKITLFFLLAISNCFGQERISFDFEKRELLKPILEPGNGIAMSAIPDNSGISTLFDKLSVSLQNPNDSLSGAVFAGFYVPVKTATSGKFIYYQQDLRGMIDKDSKSRVLIILNIGGLAKTIEFPYGRKFKGDLFRSFPHKALQKNSATYSATIGIVVERRDPKSIAYVSIDSFDLTMSEKKPKKLPQK